MPETQAKQREALMQQYADEYKRTTGEVMQIDYRRGWYWIYTGGGYQRQCRASDIRKWTETLKTRPDASTKDRSDG